MDERHPCFNKNASNYARMHIPVAPQCNIQCNYCNRKYDCLNESRPGVTSEILSPEQSLAKFKEVKSKLNNLSVVGIAGPGDALANFKDTKKAIELIKEESPEIIICLSTNGLLVEKYADEIKSLDISHITITINAIDPKIGAKIYDRVTYEGKNYKGEEGAALLIDKQLKGLKAMTDRGMVCKVNIVMIKGINDTHIEEVVKKVEELGAFITNIMPLIPAEGSNFENMPLTSNRELNLLRMKCSSSIKQMYHCKQCRADAIGLLGQDCSIDFRGASCSGNSNDDSSNLEKDFTVAVATKTGRLIDQHFGQVTSFAIYKYSMDGSVKFVEERTVPQYCGGPEECNNESKIDLILKTIEDCDSVFCLRIGNSPKSKLQEKNIRVIETYDVIENGIRKAMEEIKEAI